MARLEDLRAKFSDHDTVLHLLLGCVSLSQRLEQQLPAPAAATASSPAAGFPDEEEEKRLHLLLGLVGLRHTVMKTLGPLRTGGSSSRPPAASPAHPLPTLRELLR